YDVGKFLASQGCIDAMNLDGGGSTTMVVGGKTVTANANHAQRRVAVALGVFAPAQAQNLARVSGTNFRPTGDISSFIGSTTLPFAAAYNEAVSEPLSDPLMTSLMQHDLHLSNKVTAAAATITIDEIAEQETNPPAEDAINITIKP
ncbi:MAG: phosphodiester glycosidase family protein, partial [Candidatus Obscuribacter sp.]|nr:phosphodiester glycosidase family protein [Candidatus Obscuribacter sp.]